ncbi:MAG: glycosyltransferase domain-containing protein, partial [bacterium]
GEKTPNQVYKYLDISYKELKSFPKGKDEEEITIGDTEKHTFLSYVHEKLAPGFYFEIGVQKGKSLRLARCPAIGIDPMPQISTALSGSAKLLALTSDEFFQGNPENYIKKVVDLAFIDGMHLFEFVLRDFINVEKICSKHSVILIDDVFPGHPAQAERERKTRNWTGDVWKIFIVLQKFRPDLTLIPVNVSPTGILIITNLNSDDCILQDNYESIVKEYSLDMQPPKDIINRRHALPSHHKSIENILREINRRRVKNKTKNFSGLKNIFNKEETKHNSIKKTQKIHEKIAVYTAISGCCDKLNDSQFITPDVDYICFTDNPHLRSKVWDIRPLPENKLDNNRKAKFPKILPHRLFPDHQLSLWVDGNICLKSDLRPLIISSLEESCMALFRHPENRESVDSELQSCIKMNKDDPETLKKQIQIYKSEGLLTNQAPPTCMIILRRHHDHNVKLAMEFWWEQILKYSCRDQISFPYIAWKHDLKYKIIDDYVRDNNYIKWNKHNIKADNETIKDKYKKSDAIILSLPGSGVYEISDLLKLQLIAQHHNIYFSNNYYDLYQDCPGQPVMIYPELLSQKPLIVLQRDLQGAHQLYFEEKNKQDHLHFSDYDEFVTSDIYGMQRFSNFFKTILSFYNEHPGPKLLIDCDDLCSNTSLACNKIKQFFSEVKRDVTPDINAINNGNTKIQGHLAVTNCDAEKNDIFIAAEQAMNQKKWQVAVTLWKNLFARYKDQVPPESYVLYSMAHRFQGNPAQAEAVIIQGIKKFPEDIKIHAEYAQVAKARGNFDLAAKHLKISKMLNQSQPDKDPIVVVDTDKIDSFSYSDPQGVAVIMPCIDTELGLKTADILQRRAGMPCKIIIANDTLRQGFIKTANEVFGRLDVKYVVYLAQDVFPGRDWLALSYESLEKTGKGLLAFNDGKWHGKTASFGLVRTEWVKSLYKNNLFYNAYVSTGADAELSAIAIAQNLYIYNSSCLLIEIDYLKDVKGYGNIKDRNLFKKRLANCFDSRTSKESLLSIANEYAVSFL